MSDTKLCPKCNGRRYVFDPSCLGLTVALPFIAFFEMLDGDDEDKITKRPCPTCNGVGWIKPPKEF